MKLGKKAHYAILFVIYLSRAGRARTRDVAESLGLSPAFMEQIARRLRQKEIVRSIRGPGGGYELMSRSPEPSIGDVLRAMDVPPLLNSQESCDFALSPHVEYRALGEVVGGMSSALTSIMNQPIGMMARRISAADGALLDSLNDQATAQ